MFCSIPPLALLIASLLPYALTLTIPEALSTLLVARQSDPVIPDPKGRGFITLILTPVNEYRPAQDANPLWYDGRLADYAAGLANECNIESKADSQYGEIITGGSPSVFGRDSWDGFPLIDATKVLIQRWYEANTSYTLDPTFQVFPFDKTFTQLVWKATTHVGCAWTPAKCEFDAASAFYLRCAFSSKGNIDGYFQGNVSCNGCPGRDYGPGALNSAVGLPRTDESHAVDKQTPATKDSKRGRLTGLDERDITLKHDDNALAIRQNQDDELQKSAVITFNSLRSLAGLKGAELKRSGPMVTQSYTDADKCDGLQSNKLYPQTVYRYDEFNGKKHTVEMTWEAFKLFSHQKTLPDEDDKLDYNVIVDPNNKQVGCAWSTKCGPIHYLYCTFYQH